jgi:hypothetical protein
VSTEWINLSENPLTSTSSALSVIAYPVPTQDYLTVEISSERSTAVNLEILDVTGLAQIVQEIRGVKGVQTVQIPVTDLEKGIYLLSIRNGGEAVIQRFVKM